MASFLRGMKQSLVAMHKDWLEALKTEAEKIAREGLKVGRIGPAIAAVAGVKAGVNGRGVAERGNWPGTAAHRAADGA